MSRKYLYFSVITSAFFHFLIIGHGFGSNTLIESSNNTKKTIYSMCLHSLHNKTFVSSYDLDKNNLTNQRVKIGKKSKSNCHFRLGFDNQLENDIFCTPSQEFYLAFQKVWIPAYQLKPGDALLTKDMTAVAVTRIELVKKSLKIYMLEIEDSHTFFVGKYSVLTHNILLPMAASVGFVIPFGSVTTGGIGSFFGPIGIVGGLAFGSLFSIVIKSFYDNRIANYQTPKFDIGYIENNCKTIDYNQNSAIKPVGCFSDSHPLDKSYSYPTEYLLPQTSTGCIEIEIKPTNQHQKNSCNRNDEIEKPSNGCFEQSESKEQLFFYSQEKNFEQENKNNHPPKLTARNWKEFEENTPIGKKYGKKFIHTRKQNPKDNSPIRQLSEDIPNTEMFKKNYFFALDRFHDGDHFEVWNKREKWIGVANLDGSKNEKKTIAVKDKNKRNLPT